MVVIGASGDLAKKKIYPALFALYVEGHMPEYFTIWGFARSKMSNEEFREYIGTSLSCRLTDKGNCAEKFDAFLERCFYHPGQYSNRDDFAALSDKMKEPEKVFLSQSYVAICTILMILLLTCSHGSYVPPYLWPSMTRPPQLPAAYLDVHSFPGSFGPPDKPKVPGNEWPARHE